MSSVATTTAKQPRIAILDGLGLNCGYETQHAFKKAGAQADKILINRLMQDPNQLDNYDMIVFQGGFSAGDHLGSGKYLAKIIENNKDLFEKIKSFANNPKKLIMGICNGFQVLTNLGLLPGALSFNEEKAPSGCLGQMLDKVTSRFKQFINPGRYQNRWVDLAVQNIPGPWFKKMDRVLSLPIAHGEGRYVHAGDTLKPDQVALKYTDGKISREQGLSYNPNGSEKDIAAVTNKTGNVLGMMPHPERAIYKMHQPGWASDKSSLNTVNNAQFNHQDTTPAFKVFKNIVQFLQSA